MREMKLRECLKMLAEDEAAAVQRFTNPGVVYEGLNRGLVVKHVTKDGIYYRLTEDGWTEIKTTLAEMKEAE